MCVGLSEETTTLVAAHRVVPRSNRRAMPSGVRHWARKSDLGSLFMWMSLRNSGSGPRSRVGRVFAVIRCVIEGFTF